MRPSDTTVRIESLQWLRALAAMMVLIGHVLEEAAHYRGIGAGAAALPWTRGVDVFFVISGVVIALAGQRHAGSTSGAGAFLVRRVIRVVPLYWMFTTLMVAALVVAPGGVKETELDPGQIAASYLFLPYERHDGRIAPVLSLGWTLNYEMFFYLLAAVALAWRWPRAAGILTGLLLALALAGWLFAPETTAARFWTTAPTSTCAASGVTRAAAARSAPFWTGPPGQPAMARDKAAAIPAWARVKRTSAQRPRPAASAQSASAAATS